MLSLIGEAVTERRMGKKLGKSWHNSSGNINATTSAKG